MRIILSWIFENKDNIQDPLMLVEKIYADFDYPEEIYDLIRYNVPKDGCRPQDYSKKENTQRLMKKFKNYCNSHISI